MEVPEEVKKKKKNEKETDREKMGEGEEYNFILKN